MRRRDHQRDLALAYLGFSDVTQAQLDRVVRGHVIRVLAATDHNLSLAAELLGMHRRTLQRQLQAARRRRRRRS